MAGALTPTEVFQAYSLGSDVVKIFPGSLGGPAYIKALKGPFPYIPMMPTGGVSADNVAEWFAAGVVAVGAGSELCPPELAKDGKFDEISQRAADFVKVIAAQESSMAIAIRKQRIKRNENDLCRAQTIPDRYQDSAHFLFHRRTPPEIIDHEGISRCG